jgi:hypothetical protein
MLLAAGVADAAVIRGVVVENLTGKPLVRATVTVQEVGASTSGKDTARTDRFGAFSFSMQGGSYLVTASRPGFATAYYGQADWKAAGRPIVVEDVAAVFLNIRLRRLGAIIGAIVDENEIGLPEHEVVVYRATRPPQLLTKVKADERGIFRLAGLDPGAYLVRSLAKRYEEGSYLPTFAKESATVQDALSVQVNLDDQVEGAIVKPAMGELFSVTGSVQALSAKGRNLPVTVTLVSDTGREKVETESAFRFENLPPGRYEIFGEATDPYRAGMLSAFQTLDVSRDSFVTLNLQAIYETAFLIAGPGGPRTRLDNRAQVMARRKDLAGSGAAAPLRLRYNRAALGLGRWEVMAVPEPRYSVTAFSGPRGELPRGRADGRNEFLVSSPVSQVRFTLSEGCVIYGTVMSAREPVAGAPVLLEGYDPVSRQRVLDLRETRTDTRGRYRIEGLAPGDYRILSTFEYRAPETDVMDATGARGVKLASAQDLQLDLELFGVR